MPGIYAKLRKIKNPSYRIFNYLEDENKQEEILDRGGIQEKSFWNDLEAYERANQKSNTPNNEALEIMLTLPNSLAEDRDKLKAVINDYLKATEINQQPYTYAVHTKHKGAINDNLHVHIVFSERQINKEREIKTYKKDIWQDKDTHKLTKANAPNSELVHRKGEQVFKEGQPVYNLDPFTIKTDKFKQQNFVFKKNEIARQVLEKYGYKYQTRFKNQVKLKQYHLPNYLKAKNQTKYNEIKSLNKTIQNYNKNVSNVWNKKPNLKNKLINDRKELIKDIKKTISIPQITNVITKATTLIGKLVVSTIQNNIALGTAPQTNSRTNQLNAFSQRLNNYKNNYLENLEQQPQEQENERNDNYERER